MSEREHSQGLDHGFAAPASVPRGVPGKSTLTSRLGSVVILRREDGTSERLRRGADPEAAVDRAASASGGAPLPGEVRERFESSLGADLSAVRVHTGPASEEAAAAVGAQAYTVGNDVHFARGRYQPDDPFGLHLLAHEVAHTQQQSGGPTVRQHKLEVSGPGDAAEVDADRAADAMVTGNAVTVGSSAAGAIQRKGDGEDGAVEAIDAELRRQAGNRLDRAYTKYVDAANLVLAELQDKAKEDAEGGFLSTLLEIVAGVLLPGYANLLTGNFRKELHEIVEAVMSKLPNTEATIRAYTSIDAFMTDKLEIKDDHVAKGLGAVRGALFPTPSGRSLELQIKSVKEAFSVVVQDIDGSIGSMSRNEVVAIHAAYDARLITIDHFSAAIRDQLKDQAEFRDGHPNRRLVMLEAWGVKQPAYIQSVMGSLIRNVRPHFTFMKWVPAELRASAIANINARPDAADLPREIVGGEPIGTTGIPLQGHIDDPDVEGERVVKVDAWGKYRYCVAKVTGSSKGEWISWFKDTEESYALARAARQPGGLTELDGSAFEELPEPGFE